MSFSCVLVVGDGVKRLPRRNIRYIVTYIPIARQGIRKHTSLKIENVFSAWSVQSGYKEMFSTIK
jgi:hypothetical protein